MLTDEELAEAFEALDRAPAPAEVDAVVSAAGRSARRAPTFVLTGIVAVAAAVVAVVTLTPASDEREVPATAGTLLAEAAAAARQQPAFTGYRYTDVVSRFRHPVGGAGVPFMETEQRRETWVDRDWRGHEIVHRGRIVDGRRPQEHDGSLDRREGPFAYGDAPKAFPDKLPTEPEALKAAIVDSLNTEDWQERPTDPVPKEDWIEYHVVRRAILLLELANTTPELRGGLWGVLALAPGVERAPEVGDPLGRPGEAIKIPLLPFPTGGRITVIFDPATSALLYFSEEHPHGWERHTILRTAHVRRIGDRE
jgi:hypothetical protein